MTEVLRELGLMVVQVQDRKKWRKKVKKKKTNKERLKMGKAKKYQEE